jgi:membrane fusion protein, adhesin transport system
MDSEPGTVEQTADEMVGTATRAFFVICLVLVVGFGLWISFGELDIVSVATGQVTPSSQVKSVQHLEGGIVSEILIEEGDLVAAGQPLVVLKSTANDADVGELQASVNAFTAEVARLEAEAAGLDRPIFDAKLQANHPELVREALALFHARSGRLANNIASQNELITQRRQDIREISARDENNKTTLELLEEQIAISDELLKDDLTNRYNHLSLLQDASQLKGRIAEDRAALERSRSTLKEAQAQLAGIHSRFSEEAHTELENARRQLEERTQRLLKYEDSQRRTVLRSPVDGTIKTLNVATLGGVLRPGLTVVEIVPGEDRLVIEARLPTQDIGYVRAGQKTFVKLASADAVRFDALIGEVTNVSPDTLVTSEGVPFYKVRIETDADHFGGDLRYNLFPGMQVVASIHTGRRTILRYLLDPFLASMDGALRER